MRANTLKLRLLDGAPCRGLWLSLPSVAAARLVAPMPWDWMVVDAEHGPMGAETMTQMVAAIADAGRAPVVRVAQGSVENIKRALDAGAWGIIAPMVNSAAQAEEVVAEIRNEGGTAYAHQADVAREDQVEAMFERMLTQIREDVTGVLARAQIAPPEEQQLPVLPSFLTTHIDPFSGDDDTADIDAGTGF